MIKNGKLNIQYITGYAYSNHAAIWKYFAFNALTYCNIDYVQTESKDERFRPYHKILKRRQSKQINYTIKYVF